MSTPAIFEKHGLSEDELKKYWTNEGKNEKRDALKDLIRTRVREGIESGLRDHKIWWAVDLAYDAPFNQLAPTIVRDILSKHQDTREILDALKNWNVGIDDIIIEKIVDGKVMQILNVPAFFQVIVPLVKAYVTIRRAKLFNDRNVTPLFKYEASKNNTLNKLIGEIVTDIVEQISSLYGYRDLLKQIILQMLQYGSCFQFPMEEWHEEQQTVERNGKETDETIREGLRYWLPHPSRTFWDMNHRPSTFNTDSGCEWGGYWRVNRYSGVVDNEKYWNTDKIAYGTKNWASSYKTYFTEVSPCTMAWPSMQSTATTGAGRDDREHAVNLYSTNDRDKAVFTVELFMKLIPKDWHLGDYKHRTWMRFVVGGDDTVLWNKPLSFPPIIYWGYDPDESRKRNSSFSLELLPYQDHFSNFMTQYIFSIKQNLTRMVWYDTAQVGKDSIDAVENLGKRRYGSVPFVPYNSRQARVAGVDIEEAFSNVNFPLHNTSEIVTAMTTTLSILERIMVISNQEIGQQATHEQSAEETKTIAGSTLTRVNFTGSGLDSGTDAWKKQLYRAARANLKKDVTAQASLNVPGASKALEKLGFKVKESETTEDEKKMTAKVEVLGKMDNLELEYFISSREGQDRTTSMQAANAIAQVLQPVLANERLFEAVGEEQIVELVNQFAHLAGMNKDFKLMAGKGGGARQALAEEVAKMAGQIKEAAVGEAVQVAGEQIAKPLIDQLVATDKQVKELVGVQATSIEEARKTVQMVMALAQRLQAVESMIPSPPGGPLPPEIIPNVTGTA